jgi:hypothetical protein
MDTALALTRGSPVGAWAALNNLRLEHGSYTGILRPGNSQPPLVGQVHYTAGERAARIAYIMPKRALESPELGRLLENLSEAACLGGAICLLAEVELNSPVVEQLRHSGFIVYARQWVWKITQTPSTNTLPKLWEPASSLDVIAIRNLFQSLVPPLVQSAEPASDHTDHGFVYEKDGDLLGYVEAIYGPQGIYLLPLIHPDCEDVPGLIASLIASTPFQLGRPIYISIRSYQAWLENPLADLQATSSERQALLVKHLAEAQRAPAYATRNGVMEKHQPAMVDTQGGETTLPLVQHKLTGKNGSPGE